MDGQNRLGRGRPGRRAQGTEHAGENQDERARTLSH
jgi:hypothetical protein